MTRDFYRYRVVIEIMSIETYGKMWATAMGAGSEYHFTTTSNKTMLNVWWERNIFA